MKWGAVVAPLLVLVLVTSAVKNGRRNTANGSRWIVGFIPRTWSIGHGHNIHKYTVPIGCASINRRISGPYIHCTHAPSPSTCHHGWMCLLPRCTDNTINISGCHPHDILRRSFPWRAAGTASRPPSTALSVLPFVDVVFGQEYHFLGLCPSPCQRLVAVTPGNLNVHQIDRNLATEWVY